MVTGKYFSKALILASTNPQYDKRLFMDYKVQYMKTTSSEHVVYICMCIQRFQKAFREILPRQQFKLGCNKNECDFVPK